MTNQPLNESLSSFSQHKFAKLLLDSPNDFIIQTINHPLAVSKWGRKKEPKFDDNLQTRYRLYSALDLV